MNAKSKVGIVGGILFIAVVSYSVFLLHINQKVLRNNQATVAALRINQHLHKTGVMLQSYNRILANHIQHVDVSPGSFQIQRLDIEQELVLLNQLLLQSDQSRANLKALIATFMSQDFGKSSFRVNGSGQKKKLLKHLEDTRFLQQGIEQLLLQNEDFLHQKAEAGSTLGLLLFRLTVLGSVFLLFVFVVCFWFLWNTFRRQRAAEEKERESDLKRRVHEKLLQAIVDNSPSIIYLKDQEGRYTLVNERFKKLMHLPEFSIIGKTHKEIVARDYVQYKQSDEAGILETGEPSEFVEQIFLYREKRDFLTIKFPLRDVNGQIFGLGGICTDITDRTRYENELKQARKIAEDSKNNQERFLANMSHEIRTPVNNVIGVTNLLDSTPLTDEQKEYLSIIRQSSNILIVIVNDILDLSKIRAGMLDVNKEQVDFRQLARQIIMSFKVRADQKGIDLEYVVDECLPSNLLADPVRISQILSNLVNNAVKFTSIGVVKLMIEVASLQDDVCMVKFVISDTGIGIHASKLNLIFSSFTQSESNTARDYGGTGLGLAIVKELTQLMGGTVNVISEPGRGSTFEVQMPFALQKGGKAPLPDFYQVSDVCLNGKSILVVEDNLLNQNVARQTLQRAGGAVEVADNGFVALFLLKERKFDLVLMDMYMADMDGIETTLKIRNELKLSTPVIALTAAAMKEDQEMCMKAGMNGYVTKPFVADELVTTILRTLSN